MDVVATLREVYQPIIEFSDSCDDDLGWRPTALPGWCVRDLIFHLATDCQRALVALATPAGVPADTDEVSYWSGWQPNTSGAHSGLRGTRIQASAWTSVRGPAELYTETARAVLVAAARADLADVVRTQGHALSVEALLRTLIVEATVHHIDVGAALPTLPRASGLAEVRHVLDGLLGVAAPADWDDVRYLQLGTGRADLSSAERAAIGDAAANRFPLFG